MTERPPGGEPGDALTIRRAVRRDLESVGRLGAMLVEAHYAFDARRFLAATPGTKDGYASFLGSQLDLPDAAIFVADDGGTVIGYAYAALEPHDYMMLRGPAGVLHDLIVEPGSRGRGVGKLLLDAALAFVRSHDLRQIVLSTAERNEAAQRLFASAGFRRTMIEMTREL